jgi:hypothetical protein
MGLQRRFDRLRADLEHPAAAARSMSRSSACMNARSERAMVAASFM